MPALISCKVAVFGALTEESVTSAEAYLRDLVAWQLIASSCGQVIDSEASEALLTIEEVFGVAARSAELDKVYGIGILLDYGAVLGSHSVDHERDLLVMIDVARQDVLKKGCVAQAVVDFALVFRAIFALNDG